MQLFRFPYTHQILFHSLTVFNRYLNSAWAAAEADGSLRPPSEVNSSRGRLLDMRQIYLYYYVCLYAAIKFFTTLHSPPSIYTILHPYYRNEESLKQAEDFERLLIGKYIALEFYKDGPYEVLDTWLLRPITDRDAQIMLERYVAVSSEGCSDVSITDWVRESVIPNLENTKGYIAEVNSSVPVDSNIAIAICNVTTPTDASNSIASGSPMGAINPSASSN